MMDRYSHGVSQGEAFAEADPAGMWVMFDDAQAEIAPMQADIALLRKTEQRLRAQLESAHVLIAGLDRRAIAHGKERAELAAKAADVASERAANAALTAELEQRQRPLTEYEVDRLWLQRVDLYDGELMPQLRDFARAVQAAHGIGDA